MRPALRGQCSPSLPVRGLRNSGRTSRRQSSTIVLPPTNPNGSMSSATRTPGSRGSWLSSRWISSLDGSSFDGRSGHLNARCASGRSARPDRVARQPGATHQLLDRNPDGRNAPCAARPTRHVQHASSPALISVNTDRSRLNETPSAPPPPSTRGQISTGEGGVSLSPAPTLRASCRPIGRWPSWSRIDPDERKGRAL